MPVSRGLALAATVVALLVHLVASVVFRDAPVVGMAHFCADIAELAGRPELAASEPREAVRVVLGTAERAAFEGPGPRSTLDPVAFRRPPSLDSESPDDDRRAALSYGLFAPTATEARSVLRAQPPQSDQPSWADVEVAVAAINLGVTRETRRLPARFVAGASLAAAAEARLVKLDPAAEAARLDLVPVPQELPLPATWSDPERALRAPEIYVNVTDAK